YRRRFLEEARIAARLQHPGIPAVHQLGRLPDGSPFLTMELVKGRTLGELLKERTGPAHGLPRFLAGVEQVCQTVASPRAQGVVHLDLKPANVMVGAFGEVRVMDWGLARTLCAPGGPGGAAAGGRDAAGPGGPAVCVLGTFAYMPPEQARGEAGRADRRSD